MKITLENNWIKNILLQINFTGIFEGFAWVEKDDYSEQLLMTSFIIILLKRKTHDCLLGMQLGPLCPGPYKFKISAKNDLTEKNIALTLLYSEGYNKYIALIQCSTIICWNILKSSVHYCLSQLTFRSTYNQLSKQ